MIIAILKLCYNPEMDKLTFAKNILQKESDGIIQIMNSLDEEFSSIVDAILNLKGHLITTGIGKSGNIATKLASTFASTGTPSFFVHPADSSHGDLGMITKDDIILALSVSGNTIEMLNLLNFAHFNKIPVIGFTSNSSSTLYKISTFRILFPKFEEAGELKLAPSTSSTSMLAVGDALALTVSMSKNFRKEDFKKYHPGGALGQSIK